MVNWVMGCYRWGFSEADSEMHIPVQEILKEVLLGEQEKETGQSQEEAKQECQLKQSPEK
jgi:hypothetical protein